MQVPLWAIACLFFGGLIGIAFGVLEEVNAAEARGELARLREELIKSGRGEWRQNANQIKVFTLKR